MRAVTHRRYGPPEVLGVEEVEKPSPKANEVLVRVHATSVTSGDSRMRSFKVAGIFWLPLRLILGILKPRNLIPGMDFAGRIEEVGNDVATFKVGQPVFGIKLNGANAEYVAVPESSAIAAKPALLSYEEAAAIPFGALSSLVFLREVAVVRPGHKVLIYGASGALGVFAVQLAKHFGATVTAVCSAANLDLVRSLGADDAIDYTVTDYTMGSGGYDIILDTVGVTSFSRCKRLLAPQGRHVFVTFGLSQILQMAWTSLWGGKRVVIGMSGNSKRDLLFVKGLVEAGLLRPVIDRIYAMQDIVEAHRRVDSGRKRGSLIIKVFPQS